MTKLLTQPTLPSLKQARAVVKGAVAAMPEGTLKAALQAGMPDILADLKARLKAASHSDVKDVEGPARKKSRTAAAAGVSTLQGYHASSCRAETATAAELAVLLTARRPPHAAVLSTVTQVAGSPTAETIRRVATAACSLASACPAAAAHVALAPAVDSVAACVHSIAEAVITRRVRFAATCSSMSASDTARLDACVEACIKMRAICVLQGRSSCASGLLDLPPQWQASPSGARARLLFASLQTGTLSALRNAGVCPQPSPALSRVSLPASGTTSGSLFWDW